MANSDPPGGGRNKQISENEEEIRGFYCLALKNEEEIRRRKEKKLEILAKIFTPVTYLKRASPQKMIYSVLPK